MKNFLKEFKEFAIKGNMIDIAIGVIIGGAFNKVVNVLVKEIFLPPLSLLTDGSNWSDRKWILREGVEVEGQAKIEEIAIGYGKLIEAGFDFLIIGFTVFLVVKFMNVLRARAQDPEDKAVSTPKEIEYLKKNTDLLERQVVLLEKIAQEQ